MIILVSQLVAAGLLTVSALCIPPNFFVWFVVSLSLLSLYVLTTYVSLLKHVNKELLREDGLVEFEGYMAEQVLNNHKFIDKIKKEGVPLWQYPLINTILSAAYIYMFFWAISFILIGAIVVYNILIWSNIFLRAKVYKKLDGKDVTVYDVEDDD